jgi:cytochrome P450
MTSSSVSFDYTSPEMEGDGFWEAVAELQRQGPLVWVETGGGFWAATSQAVISQIAQNWQTFTSSEGVALTRPSFEAMPRLVPLELDPPLQRIFRQPVKPKLTPKAITGLEGPIRDIADELIDTFIDNGSCDIAVDFARKFPGTVFFRLITHCTDEDFRTAEPSARVISFESDDPVKFADAAAKLRAWAAGVFESRSGRPELDDLVDAIMHLNDEGKTFEDHELRSGLQILAQGGIGTSASAIGAIVLALCADQDLQRRVRQDPSLIPTLIEECLRLEAPVPLMFRTAQHDVEVAGQQIKQGDKVCLVLGAAGRDPEVFEHAGDVDLDRPHCRHFTFGVGVHRCLGSNLARMQIRIAIEQLLARLGSFHVAEGSSVQYSSRQSRGPSSIPLVFASSE